MDLWRRHSEAEEMAMLSLEARQYECGAESMAAAASLQALAAARLAAGRATEAEELCQCCLKIRCSSHPSMQIFPSEYA